ncbi:hypothetical protein ACFVUS_25560 [Nocardia sp. NPDC058058]|uniref:hypothetical protein n=1 Tax=Nocardia sp. NPDC058058 TaxID=3346317 RepID=UPI0036DE1BDE
MLTSVSSLPRFLERIEHPQRNHLRHRLFGDRGRLGVVVLWFGWPRSRARGGLGATDDLPITDCECGFADGRALLGPVEQIGCGLGDFGFGGVVVAAAGEDLAGVLPVQTASALVRWPSLVH